MDDVHTVVRGVKAALRSAARSTSAIVLCWGLESGQTRDRIDEVILTAAPRLVGWSRATLYRHQQAARALDNLA